MGATSTIDKLSITTIFKLLYVTGFEHAFLSIYYMM